jgi:regulator of replication initiation timing
MHLVVEQRKDPAADFPNGLTSTPDRRHGGMADRAPLRTIPATGTKPFEPQNARAPTAREGTNVKAGSVTGVVRSEKKDAIALQDQVHRLFEENQSLKDEIEDVKAQLADAKTLSEIRGKELKDAQVWLTKADTLSTTDVVQKVIALNEEIFQAAALLGEVLQNAERKDRTQEQITEAFEKARWMLGERMASFLDVESSNLRTDLNPLLPQVVLQIAITTWCGFVVSTWKPSDSTVADFLAAIYSEIRQTGE